MSRTKIRPKDALDYHENKPAGKIEVNSTKPVGSQHDLALAYSPGVAEPCKVIAEDKEAVYKYTAKGNLVGVISNGTAVLGLGNIGPEASKPVMEGCCLVSVCVSLLLFSTPEGCRGPATYRARAPLVQYVLAKNVFTRDITRFQPFFPQVIQFESPFRLCLCKLMS